jgi:hydrogenase expression/formation protein HypE
MVLPIGKLPPDLLEKIIRAAPTSGHRVKLGPGIGLDCAILDFGDHCLVLKTEPITFASQDIGWYAVQIAANDIATTGARPKWLMLTALLPEGITSPALVESVSAQVAETCRSLEIILIGGHTEITYGLDRPILVSTLIAEIKCHDLITPKGAMPGDRLVLTKGVPIEATALLAREFPDKLQSVLTQSEIKAAQNFIFEPGLSVLPEAQIACNNGKITAMHDPTEGGIVTALWELAEACDHTLVVEFNKIHVPEISKKICAAFQLNPLGTISSGALLMSVHPSDTTTVISKLLENGILASEIGYVEAGPPKVLQITPTGQQVQKKFMRDEITRVFESAS